MRCLVDNSHKLPMVKTNNEDVEVKGSDSKTKSSDEIIYTRNVTIDLNNMADAIGPQTNIPFSCDDENYQLGNDTNRSSVIKAETNKPRNRDDFIDERNPNKQGECDTNGDSLVARELAEDVLQEIENKLDILENEDTREQSMDVSHNSDSSTSDNESIQDQKDAIDQAASRCGVGDRYQYVPVDVAEDVLREIENKLELLEDIPDICDDIPIECFCEDTQHRLCYHLDPESHTMAESGLTKDYMGLGEWIQLETLFMKYLQRTMMTLKTIEVLGKWITSETGPHPTIGNFKDCMINGIDRPDVVMDLAKHITKDAIAWIRTGSEACTAPQTKTDKSWQLTRHDVVSGKKTYYTCCLVYANEDEGMAQIITQLYKSVCKQALFFLPQFDLKIGKYEFDTTARAIQDRCGGRVIFILSEYFFASEVCRFAVQFSRAMDAAADAGNLIPFHLTSKFEHVPRVLKGISGIRWFRRSARKMSWKMITDNILGGRMEAEQLEALKYRLLEHVERNSDVYLGDPPYDNDTPAPGPPIEVYDPPLTGELSKLDPESYMEQLDQDVLVAAAAKSEERSSKVSKMLKHVKKRTVGAIYRLLRKKANSDIESCDQVVAKKKAQ